MATTTIPWGDGSGDNIYLTYSASTGDQTVLVSSDANGGAARQKVITFVSTVGNISRSLTVLQESGMDLVSITWNDVCITYDDTAIAYPYVEQYIVFADPVVEQICATNWGDGVGLKPSQAAKVTNAQFGNTFQNNTDITTFDEFRYFTGITSINQGAFNDSSLESIVLPPSVVSINAAFVRCTSLLYIDIPDGAVFSQNGTFSDDSSLAQITFRGATTFTAGYIFQRCTNLHRVNIPDIGTWFSFALTQVKTIGQYSHDVHLYLIGSETEITAVVIPNTITTIQQYACFYCTGITSVTIPSSVTSIGANAFAYCSGLSSITVPSSVTSAPMSAFIYSGHKEGKLYIGGDLTGQNNTYFGYGEVEIAGDFISSGAGHQFGRAAEQEPSIYDFILRVGGDLTKTTSGNLFFALNVVFIEIGGQFTWSGGAIGSLKSGCIVHLGYDGIAGVVSSSNFGATNISKVYVGDGSSAAHDNAILAQYTADADWSAYSSKLDTWYNYINDPNANPDYIN